MSRKSNPFIPWKSSVVADESLGRDMPMAAAAGRAGGGGGHAVEWWWIPALAMLAGAFLWQAHFFWGAESYYNYGFAVPLLAGILIYWRFRDAPPASPDPARQRVGVIWIIALIVCAIPFRMLAEINPFWRVPILAHGLILVGIGCLVFWIRGGVSVMRHFAFPVLFLLTMLPWPYRIEVVVIQEFSDQVMKLTESLLLFLGHPARQSGSSLLIGGDRIDVNDACSGIRSIQTLTMSALFLGELFRLPVFRRGLLLVITVLLVLVFNSGRALALALIFLQDGRDAFEHWHDQVGLISFLLSLGALYGISLWLKRGHDTVVPRKTLRWGTGLLSPRGGVFLFIAAVASLTVSEGWFRINEMGADTRPGWTLQWERAPVPAHPQEFSQSVLDILNFDFGEQMYLQLDNRREADVFFYGYTGEDRVKSVSTFGHSPIICMAAAGIPIAAERAPLNVRKGDLSLNLNHYVFAPSHLYEKGDLHAFWLVWESRFSGVPAEDLLSLNYGVQLRLLLEGRRDFGRQVLLIAIKGTRTAEEARDEARRLVTSILQPETVAAEPSPSIARINAERSGARKKAVPATKVSTPAVAQRGAVSRSIPPSTSSR